MSENINNEIADWPLWRVALKELRSLPNFGYGLQLPAEWFEKRFGVLRDSNSFAFQMLDLRQELETADGYYLASQTIQNDETGIRMEVWQIPSAHDHASTIANSFKTKMRTYAQREAHILTKTLGNESAALNSDEKARAEAQLRISATRLVLLRREKSAQQIIAKHAPKLLSA